MINQDCLEKIRHLEYKACVSYLGMKTSALSEMLGVSEQVIRNWNSGRTRIDPYNMHKLQRLAKCMHDFKTSFNSTVKRD